MVRFNRQHYCDRFEEVDDTLFSEAQKLLGNYVGRAKLFSIHEYTNHLEKCSNDVFEK